MKGRPQSSTGRWGTGRLVGWEGEEGERGGRGWSGAERLSEAGGLCRVKGGHCKQWQAHSQTHAACRPRH